MSFKLSHRDLVSLVIAPTNDKLTIPVMMALKHHDLWLEDFQEWDQDPKPTLPWVKLWKVAHQ